jgi:sugar/nucleoside kinase (ribokinase family)
MACIGVFIVDTLGRPVAGMPQGQRAQVLEEIRLTVAGSAGGTVVDLTNLGADVVAIGAVGEDGLGAFMRQGLADAGVDPRYIVTVADVQTAASILAIGADGSRPAWHVPGAGSALSLEHVPWDAVFACDSVHVGGVSAMAKLDGPATTEILRRSSEAGLLTSVDCLGVKRPDVLELLTPALPYIDYFFPNDDELAQITGIADPRDGARHLLELGAKTVVVTCGAKGAIVVGGEGEFEVPAIESEVVDSTGCGDAMVAGTMIGLVRGLSVRRSVELGTAAASLTISRLGSIEGIESWSATVDHMERNFGVERLNAKAGR